MPLLDPRRAFIWVVTSFLFFSIITGGGCLLMYMILPESETTAWLPIVGLSFVCLPWFFWFLTFIYRLISRACGCRVSFAPGAGGTAGNASGEAAPGGDGGCENGDGGEQRRNSSSSNGSVRSRESEMPFAIAMGS